MCGLSIYVAIILQKFFMFFSSVLEKCCWKFIMIFFIIAQKHEIFSWKHKMRFENS